MSDTQLRSPSGPHPDALIVAHGAPSDPAPQEAALRALASHVADQLPGWRVRGATLAAEGALESALAGMRAPFVYPFFMAEGWFTGTNLPKRLTEAGVKDAQQLRPYGTDPDLPAVMARTARRGAQQAGMDTADAVLLIAAHGSGVSRRSADSTHEMVAHLSRTSGFARVVAGFIEEPPYLAQVARDTGQAVCLPFFALRAGHVLYDIPSALREAGFAGPTLPPIGASDETPAMIASALRRASEGGDAGAA
ncbi:MAG: CbiX/SirB N-terminal domain-containing protein [Sediminimonas sp.]|uniref:CbiX/SirB N-terminal domain-containing protein n=1 Tax=Sediminimonas sp. TaxID=2823379 RepID=UPI0028705D1D|nr:CbiX/SirB N-terminal domain-containing protein [Sediminimonas sp.]MDR9484177.1 CbiX/SirB N-terminal domain-containing protein [Sediminimonas sp.]